MVRKKVPGMKVISNLKPGDGELHLNKRELN